MKATFQPVAVVADVRVGGGWWMGEETEERTVWLVPLQKKPKKGKIKSNHDLSLDPGPVPLSFFNIGFGG